MHSYTRKQEEGRHRQRTVSDPNLILIGTELSPVSPANCKSVPK